MESGIYVIENITNGKKYIGSAKNIKQRWYSHKNALNKNSHDNSYLQRAWNKYCEDNFRFSVIEFVNLDQLLVREQYYIDLYNVCDDKNGYNLSPTAGNTLGFRFTNESKAKMSAKRRGIQSRLGAKLSDETKQKISNSHKGIGVGRKHSDETKKKISEKRKGIKCSDETKKKISDWRKGLRVSNKNNRLIDNDLKNILQSDAIKTKRNEKHKNHIPQPKTTKIKINKGTNNGEDNGMSITNKNEVINIRNDYSDGIKISKLMLKYNKKYMFIYKIVNRLRWNWL